MVRLTLGKTLYLCLLLLYMGVFTSCTTQKKTDIPQIKTLYAPPPNAPAVGAMYPRVLQIKHHEGAEGNLLATFEHYMHREPSFPIYRSTDNGETWHLYSEVEDTHNEWGMRYQPHLFELPQQVGEFPAGTIFCSGNSIPDDRSATELLVYYSTDGGKSWEFLSSIVKGGRAIYDPELAETPVWEPFLGLDNSGRLVAYYSDERYHDEGYNQLLAHKVSEDGGKTWGDDVFDVAVPDGKTRPGMSVITRLPNGKYMLIFEIVGREGYPVHYKLSSDGLDWGDPEDLGTRIENEEGHFLRSTPYVEWTPHGGNNGTIIASGMGINIDGELVGNGYMINRNLGKGTWTHIEAPIKYDAGTPGGYSQTMLPIGEKGGTILQLVPVPNGNDNHADIRYAKFNLSF